MKGSVQVKNGTFYTVIYYKDYTGANKQKWENTGLKERGNKKAADEILKKRLEAFEEDLRLKEERVQRRTQPPADVSMQRNMPFVLYVQKYVESLKGKVSPYVYLQYSHHYHNIFKEYFKDLRLIDITHEEISDFNDYLKKTRKLSNKSLANYSNVLRPALRKAYIEKVIPDNPYERITISKLSQPVINYYNRDEITRLFEAMKGHKFDLAYKLLAYYGLRRSELLGLKWKAIDFDHDTITINHKVIMVKTELHLDDKLKSKTSNRTLPLMPNLKIDLIKHKEQVGANKAYFGNAYKTEWEDYIFVDEQGELYKPDYVSKSFFKLQEEHNLKRIRLHDLRHSCASLLLANGISMKQIQDWLGHADFSTTANVYSHLDFSTKIQSANTIFNALAPTAPIVREESLDKIVLELTRETVRLGFSNLDEYINYRQRTQQTSHYLIENTNEDDTEMQ